jgi:hypothetical protein
MFLPPGSKKLVTVPSTHDGPANGGEMDGKPDGTKPLQSVGFEAVPSLAVNGPKFSDEQLADLQVGDCVVMKTKYLVDVYDKDGHLLHAADTEGAGHTAIWTGKRWVSNYRQMPEGDPNAADPNAGVYKDSETQEVTSMKVYRYTHFVPETDYL